MPGTLIQSLTSDLKGDAEKLASGKPVSAEIERKTIGRIGLLVCEFSQQLWSEEQLKAVASGIARGLIEDHARLCRPAASSLAPSEGAAAKAKTLAAQLLDKYFLHVWWGGVALCVVFGVERVVNAFCGGVKILGG